MKSPSKASLGLLAFQLVLVAAASPAMADGSLTKTFGNEWFGGTINASYVDRLTATTYNANATGDAYATVLKTPINVAKGAVSVEVTKPNLCRAKADLKVAGKTLLTLDKTFRDTATFTTPPFYSKEVGGKWKYSIGPASLTMKAYADIQIYARGSVSVGWHPSHPPVVDIRFGPVANASASGAAELDAIIASGGLEASLKLEGYSLESYVQLLPNTNKPTTITYGLDFAGDSTNGKISGWIKIGYGWLSKKWDKTFHEYVGGPFRHNITSGTRSL
jgi:hypothetical protein